MSKVRKDKLFIIESKIHDYDVVVAFDMADENPGCFVNYTHLCRSLSGGDKGVSEVLTTGRDYIKMLIGDIIREFNYPDDVVIDADFMIENGIFFIIDDSGSDKDDGVYGPRYFCEAFLMVLDPVFCFNAIHFLKDKIDQFNHV